MLQKGGARLCNDTTMCADSLSKVGIEGIQVEQAAPDLQPSQADDQGLRPDLNYVDCNNRRTHVDVEICTMHGARSNSSMRPGALIETQESVKRRKYGHLRLLPFVVSHVGRVGHSAQTLIRSVCRDPEMHIRSEQISSIYQNIACAVQHGNASIIASAGHLLPEIR